MKCKKYECYNEEVGMTVVWEEVYTDENVLKWRTIIGFYFGRPNGKFNIDKRVRKIEGSVTEYYNCK